MKQLSLTGRALLACAALILGTGNANAALIIFGANGAGNDGSLSATAEFHTSYDSASQTATITVTITNNLKPGDYTSQGQAVSSLQFTVNSTPTAVTPGSASGQLIDVGSGGLVTPLGGTPDRWLSTAGNDLSLKGNSVTLAVAGNQVGGGNPTEMILGLPDNTGAYPNANSGGATNGHFDPWVEGSATFTVKLSGLSSLPDITATQFGFGTSPDTTLDGNLIFHNPEPTSLALAAMSIGSLGFVRLIRSRRRALPG
jgi:hypothetical protein